MISVILDVTLWGMNSKVEFFPRQAVKILGYDNVEEVEKVLSSRAPTYKEPITEEDMLSWGKSPETMPEQLKFALGIPFITLCVTLSNNNMTLHELSTSPIVAKQLEGIMAKSIKSQEKRETIAKDVADEIMGDRDKGTNMKIMPVSDNPDAMMFKVDDSDTIGGWPIMHLIESFPYANKEEMSHSYVPGAELYLAVKNGLQPRQEVTIPLDESMCAGLSLTLDSSARRAAVFVNALDSEGGEVVASGSTFIDFDKDRVTYSDAASMIMAEVLGASGPSFFIRIDALNEDNERTIGIWSFREGVVTGLDSSTVESLVMYNPSTGKNDKPVGNVVFANSHQHIDWSEMKDEVTVIE